MSAPCADCGDRGYVVVAGAPADCRLRCEAWRKLTIGGRLSARRAVRCAAEGCAGAVHAEAGRSPAAAWARRWAESDLPDGADIYAVAARVSL